MTCSAAPDLHDRLVQLDTDLHAWTGNDLQLVEHSAESWRALVPSDNPLVEQIRRDGIALAGDAGSLLQLLMSTLS